jgi:hypothetical protein
MMNGSRERRAEKIEGARRKREIIGERDARCVCERSPRVRGDRPSLTERHTDHKVRRTYEYGRVDGKNSSEGRTGRQRVNGKRS